MISSSSMTRILLMASRPSRPRRAHLFGERQTDGEARALADLAVAGDRAAVFLHDAVRDREPEAGALANLLGREERIVDARQLLGRNARAGVADFDDRAAAVLARHDREPAPFGHRVPGVEEQVQEYLLQFVFDALDDRRRRRELLANLDAAGTELVLEQRQHV